MPSSTGKLIERFGPVGARVSVVEGVVRGTKVYLVRWTSDGRKQQQFPRTKPGRVQALQRASALATTLVAAEGNPPASASLTTRELFAAFQASVFPSLRSKTQQLYLGNWAQWSAFVGPHQLAEGLGSAQLAQLSAELRARGLRASTIGGVVRMVKQVYRWAADEVALLPHDRMRAFRHRVAKEDRSTSPAEYSPAEWEALAAQLPLEGRTTWRAGLLVRLCGLQGMRQNAVLHLRWSDVDWASNTVRWAPEFDKMGHEGRQHLRAAAVEALHAVQARWADGVTDWVFPSAQGRTPVYTIQSAWAAIRRAEEGAGILHLPGRAGHGFRRMVAGEVARVTGSVKTAMQAIGDRDLRMADRYLKERPHELREAFQRLDAEHAKRASTNKLQTAALVGASPP